MATLVPIMDLVSIRTMGKIMVLVVVETVWAESLLVVVGFHPSEEILAAHSVVATAVRIMVEGVSLEEMPALRA